MTKSFLSRSLSSSSPVFAGVVVVVVDLERTLLFRGISPRFNFGPRGRALAHAMAEFTRLDDEDEVLEDACAEVAASAERLRTSLRPLEGPLPPAAVDQTLTLCAPPRQRVCVHGARAHRRRQK